MAGEACRGGGMHSKRDMYARRHTWQGWWHDMRYAWQGSMYGKGACIMCGSKIWSRGTQLLRQKVAGVAKLSCEQNEYMRLGSRANLRFMEAFGILILKYTFSNILETLFLSFLTSVYINAKNFTIYISLETIYQKR